MTVNRARTGTFRPAAATPPATRQNVTPTTTRQAGGARFNEFTRAKSLIREDDKSKSNSKESLFNRDDTTGPPDDEKDDDKKAADDAVTNAQRDAGDAGNFKPLHGDLTPDEEDSNANATTPADNDTGVPSTPSGVKAPSNA
jgi:hypothetical protein